MKGNITMAMYEIKQDYYTGVKFVDDEHKKLFEIANTIYDLLIDEFIPDKYDYIMEVVTELKDYAKYHFKHEEEYMKGINYRKLLSHKVNHDDFIEKIEKFDADIVDENQKESLLELLDFLTSWLVEHILKKDKLFGE